MVVLGEGRYCRLEKKVVMVVAGFERRWIGQYLGRKGDLLID